MKSRCASERLAMIQRRMHMGSVFLFVALVAPATIALGQATAQSKTEWTPRQRERAAVATELVKAKAKAEITVLELRSEEGQLSVRIEGHEVIATLNGKPLPAERMQLTDQFLIVLDAKKRPMATIGRAGVASTLRARQDRHRADEFHFEFEQVIDTEPRRVIGVLTQPLDEKSALKYNAKGQTGLVITAVVPGRPAAIAGMKPDDVVIAIDGEAPATLDSLRHVIRTKSPGEPIQLNVVRSGKPLTVSLAAVEEPGGNRLLERIDENVLIPQGDAFFAWSPEDMRLAPEVERDVRTWVRDNWEVRSAPDHLKARFREMERKLQLDEQRRRELERNLRTAARSIEEMNIDGDYPEVSFFGPEGRDVAVFPRGFSRAGGAGGVSITTNVAPSEVHERLRDVEDRLQRLEQLLIRLVETTPEPAKAPASKTEPAKPITNNVNQSGT